MYPYIYIYICIHIYIIYNLPVSFSQIFGLIATALWVQGNARKGVKKSLEVDVVIGADGANSRVAKDIEAGDYEYAIAFQAMEGHPMAPQRVERIRIMFFGLLI